MSLTLHEMAGLLNIPPETLRRQIGKGRTPVRTVRDQYRFNLSEWLEWAALHPSALPEHNHTDSTTSSVSIESALRSGGVHHDLPGKDRSEILKQMAARIQLPASIDKSHLLNILSAREKMATTAVGDGLAIPHVRMPLVFRLSQPVMALFFLQDPVDFGALDGKPVRTLFLFLSPTVKTHLTLFSRLIRIIHHRRIKKMLSLKPEADQILAAVQEIETSFQEQGRTA
ncbi:MAG TPA: PTS sugar transporter subunit IIA [Elusimicrobiota bacterium]|nr:PTS sugar transporter subunit IIA [Elusimicrobiota bacterium]